MKIQILGIGCTKCRQLHQNVLSALQTAGLEAQVDKVEDMREIVKAGVMTTPALVIDGEVKSVGRVLNEADVVKLLKATQ